MPLPAYEVIMDAVKYSLEEELLPEQQVIYSSRYGEIAIKNPDGTVINFSALSDGYRNVIKIVTDIGGQHVVPHHGPAQQYRQRGTLDRLRTAGSPSMPRKNLLEYRTFHRYVRCGTRENPRSGCQRQRTRQSHDGTQFTAISLRANSPCAI